MKENSIIYKKNGEKRKQKNISNPDREIEYGIGIYTRKLDDYIG